MNNGNQLNKCYTLLKSYDTGVIATSSIHAEPHASIVNYFMHESLDMYFIAREDAQKFKNIKKNSATCLVVCTEDFESSIEVKGKSYLLEDSPKVTDLLMRYSEAIKRKYSGPLPIMRHPGSELFLFKLVPHTLTYTDFRVSSNEEGEFFEVHLAND